MCTETLCLAHLDKDADIKKGAHKNKVQAATASAVQQNVQIDEDLI